MYNGKLLSIGSNPKINKSDKSGKGFKTAILHLSPYKLSGKNFCANASPGCIDGCLNTSGHGRFDKTQEARLKRSKFFIEDRLGFLEQLHKEINAFVKHCEKRNLKPAVRLNGTSDIVWENIIFPYDWEKEPLIKSIFDWFPKVQFYDYTKSKRRVLKSDLPSNYHLTFSRSETTPIKDIRQILDNGTNVAVVFMCKRDAYCSKNFCDHYPNDFEPLSLLDSSITGAYDRVINGDLTDLRFLDQCLDLQGNPIKKGFIVCLSAKGKAKKDQSGFVVKYN